MFEPSVPHLLILLVILLLIFGAKRLPEIGRSLGHGMREFKDSVSDIGDHDRHVSHAALPPADETEPAHTTARELETV